VVHGKKNDIRRDGEEKTWQDHTGIIRGEREIERGKRKEGMGVCTSS
jgi:hypothetical protein